MRRVLALALITLFAVAASTASAASDVTIQQLQRQVKALQSQVKTLQKQMTAAREQLACDEVVVGISQYGGTDGSYGYSYTQDGQNFLTTALDFVGDPAGPNAGRDFAWFVTSDPACVSTARAAHRPAPLDLARTMRKVVSLLKF